MTAVSAALLGIIQGLTEFLPISSSAHLIFARAFLGWDVEQLGIAFDVACHLGTLVALLVYFRQDVLDMTLALAGNLAPGLSESARLVRMILLGTVPIVIVGALGGDYIEEQLRTVRVADCAMAVGAVGLLLAEHRGGKRRSEAEITPIDALVIGASQAAALVPGISRSGATLTAAMLLGFRREEAARFIFLLGIPAIVAAAGKEALDMRHQTLSGDALQLFAIGIVSSAIVGYITVKYFIRYLARHSLLPFVWYRLALAVIAFVWLFSR